MYNIHVVQNLIYDLFDLSPWSSGQDVALSRLSQGFDSPRRYQSKKPLKTLEFPTFQGLLFSIYLPEIMLEKFPKVPKMPPKCGTRCGTPSFNFLSFLFYNFNSFFNPVCKIAEKFKPAFSASTFNHDGIVQFFLTALKSFFFLYASKSTSTSVTIP